MSRGGSARVSLPMTDHASILRRNAHWCALSTRAWRIVERIKPRLTCVASGWAEPRLFIDACLYNDQRNRLFKRIFHRLLEKEPFNG